MFEDAEAVFVPITMQRSYARGNVRSVRLTRTGLSIAAGVAIGVGAGVGAGYGVQNAYSGKDDPGLAPALFGGLGALVGGGIGKATDFLGGPVIYRAP